MDSKVYEIVTERIVAALEKGTVPWRQTWAQSRWPSNLVSQKHYRGMNVFMLAAQGHRSPWWLTFNQAKALGGSVKKGEKGTPVTFWKFIERTEATDKGQRTKRIPFLRYFTVFNADQCSGLEAHVPKADAPAEFRPIEAAAAIVDGMPQRPEIRHGGDAAYYSPLADRVQMPHREAFDAPENYYSALFHELTHSTGHESRLGRLKDRRDALAPFGSADYSREELVAEMGAAFLCARAGIEGRTLDQSASYLANWIGVLKADPRAAVVAAGAAQKAADFILGEKRAAPGDDTGADKGGEDAD